MENVSLTLSLLHGVVIGAKGYSTRMNEAVQAIINIFYVLYLWLKGMVLKLVPRRLRYKEVRGEIALITGGGSGIGRLLSIRLADLGCRVVIWDVDEKGNRQTEDQVKSRGGECHSYTCDVTDRHNVYALAGKVKREVGPVSILINNAGILTGQRLLDLPDHLIEKTFQVNVISHFWTYKAFIPDMMEADHGHIVTIASMAGYCPTLKLSDYCSSKSAAIAAHESLYLELKNINSHINMTLVAPFFTNTQLFEGLDTRLVSIFPTEYVVSNIISSMRCNEEIVIIPSYYSLLTLAKSLMSLNVYSALYKLIKAPEAMSDLVGKSGKNI